MSGAKDLRGGADTDEEDEDKSLRKRRLRLASLIGVSVEQLNAAQATANYV